MEAQENKSFISDNECGTLFDGFHCDNCDIVCLSNKNPQYHPESEEEYNERMYNKFNN